MGCCAAPSKKGESTMAKEPAREEQKVEVVQHSRKSSKSPDESKQTCADPKQVNLDLSPRKSEGEAQPRVITLSVAAEPRCAFVLENGFLVTTADAMPTFEECEKVLPGVQFRSDLGFYCHPELNFAIVALDPTHRLTGFPISDQSPSLRAEVSISSARVVIEYEGEYQLLYSSDATPGSPILYKGKVIGMHDSHSRGVTLRGICKTMTSGHQCELFAQTCFRENLGLAQSSFALKIFTVQQKRLISFDTVSHKYQTYTRVIPSEAQVTFFLNSVILTGGFDSEAPASTVLALSSADHHFDALRSMATPRGRHSACVLESFVYVVSGLSRDGVTNECERFNAKKNQWLPIYPITRARVNSSCVAFKAAIYVYGGCNKFGKPVREMERFQDSSWTDMQFSADIPGEKVAMLANDTSVLLLGSNAVLWDLQRVRKLGKTREGVPGETAVWREAIVYVFSGLKVLEGRVLSTSIAWKTYDNIPVKTYLSRL